MNAARGGIERVGSIIEHRRSRRSMNRIGLAKLAQQLFARWPGDIIIVGSDLEIEQARADWEYGGRVTAG